MRFPDTLLALVVMLLLAMTSHCAAAIEADAGLSRGKPFLAHYTPSDYGAHDQNWAVAQHPNGLIYIGNNHGVLEYDGVRWRRIELPRRQSARRLLVLDDATLAVGGEGGLLMLRPDAFGQMQVEDLSPLVFGPSPKAGVVRSMERHGGALWLTTAQGVYRLELGQVQHWPLSGANRLSIVGDEILLHQFDVGILRYDRGEFLAVPELARFASQEVVELVQLHSGDWLLPSSSDGLFRFQPQTGVLSRMDGSQEKSGLDRELAEAVILRVRRLGPQRIALGTSRAGALLIDDQAQVVSRVGMEQGLLDDSVTGFGLDSEQGLWLTGNFGVARVDLEVPLRRWDEALGIRGTLVHMQQGATGPLLVASTQGLFRMQKGRFSLDQRMGPQVWRINELPDVDGSLVVTTNDRTALLNLHDDGPARTIGPGGYINLPLSSAPRSLLVGMDSALVRLVEEAQGWRQEKVSDYPGTPRSMAWDEQGQLWVGTLSRGVLKLSWPGDAQRAGPPVVEVFGAEHGLPETHYVEVHTLAGRLVFATRRGLWRLDEAQQRFVPEEHFGAFLTDPELGIFLAAEDTTGRVWFVVFNEQGRRLEVVGPVDGQLQRLNPGDLRRLPNASVQSLLAARTGGMWIGTSRGLHLFDGDSSRAPAAFETLLRRVHASGTEPLLDAAGISASRTQPDVPEMAPHSNNLRFEFGAASYVQRDQTRFRSRLIGYRPQWSDWSPEAHKEYTNLAPGAYRFEVQARNGLDLEGAPAGFEFRITAPWYRTHLAWAAWTLLALLGLYVIVRLSQRRLAARNLQLERLIAERTAEIRSQRDLLDRLAHEDALTGLGNRRHLEQHLGKEALRASHFGRGMTVAMLDIDNFKSVNDTHGHSLGDEVLKRIATIARQSVRPVDMLARYGGEEILLQFPESSAQDAAELCERLRRQIAGADWSDLAAGLAVTVSIGVAESLPGEDVAGLIERADHALYQAKAQGRNRVVIGQGT